MINELLNPVIASVFYELKFRHCECFLRSNPENTLKTMDCRVAKSAPRNDGTRQCIKHICYEVAESLAMTAHKMVFCIIMQGY